MAEAALLCIASRGNNAGNHFARFQLTVDFCSLFVSFLIHFFSICAKKIVQISRSFSRYEHSNKFALLFKPPCFLHSQLSVHFRTYAYLPLLPSTFLFLFMAACSRIINNFKSGAADDLMQRCV